METHTPPPKKQTNKKQVMIPPVFFLLSYLPDEKAFRREHSLVIRSTLVYRKASSS